MLRRDILSGLGVAAFQVAGQGPEKAIILPDFNVFAGVSEITVSLAGTNGEPYRDLVLSPFIERRLAAGGLRVLAGMSREVFPHISVNLFRVTVGSSYCTSLEANFVNLIHFATQPHGGPVLIPVIGWSSGMYLAYLGNRNLVISLEDDLTKIIDALLTQWRSVNPK